MQVFIADDSELLRELLVNKLSQLPNVKIVGEAEDVATAKQLINETVFELAIYDIKMPNGSGIDLMKYTKEKYPSTKVIMMTNFSVGNYKKKSLEAGADYFFDKSDLDKMITLIEQLSEKE